LKSRPDSSPLSMMPRASLEEDHSANWSIPDEADVYRPMEEVEVKYTANVEVETSAPEAQTNTEAPLPEAWSPEALRAAQRSDPNVGYVLA